MAHKNYSVVEKLQLTRTIEQLGCQIKKLSALGPQTFSKLSVKSNLPATSLESLSAWTCRYKPFPHGTAVTNQVFSPVGHLDLNWSLQNKSQCFLLQLQAVASESLYIHFEPEVQTEQQIQFKHIHLSCANSSNSPIVCIVEKPANKMYQKSYRRTSFSLSSLWKKQNLD